MDNDDFVLEILNRRMEKTLLSPRKCFQHKEYETAVRFVRKMSCGLRKAIVNRLARWPESNCFTEAELADKLQEIQIAKSPEEARRFSEVISGRNKINSVLSVEPVTVSGENKYFFEYTAVQGSPYE
jgi:hypothetical protein